MRQKICDFLGRVKGYIDDRGDEKVCQDYFGNTLGRYIKSRDVTVDYSGKTVARGDCVVGFLGNPKDW